MKKLLPFIQILCLAGIVLEANAQLPVPMLPLANPVAAATQPGAAQASSTATSPGPVATPALLNGYVPDDTYKLRVGDTISFQILEDKIWDDQNAPKNLVVEDSGEVDVLYIGRVMAVGKTCKQLAAEIKTALEKDYYKQATVILSLNTANHLLGRVYIWGQVRNQGALDIQVNENLTVGQAILRAGGFADFANKRKVKIVRSTPDATGKNQTIQLDMAQILEEGRIDKDIVLQPNDLIIVPSRLVNF